MPGYVGCISCYLVDTRIVTFRWGNTDDNVKWIVYLHMSHDHFTTTSTCRHTNVAPRVQQKPTVYHRHQNNTAGSSLRSTVARLSATVGCIRVLTRQVHEVNLVFFILHVNWTVITEILPTFLPCFKYFPSPSYWCNTYLSASPHISFANHVCLVALCSTSAVFRVEGEWGSILLAITASYSLREKWKDTAITH